jgi:hypothetical protein
MNLPQREFYLLNKFSKLKSAEETNNSTLIAFLYCKYRRGKLVEGRNRAQSISP